MAKNDLYQCPYKPEVKCDMTEPCLGCIDFLPAAEALKPSHNTDSPKLADLLSDALELCHDGDFDLGYKIINDVIGQLRTVR